MPNTNAMTPPLASIDHIHVYVSDRATAEKWYARVLGLQRLPSLEFWAADGGPLTIANSSGTIHLALFERPTQKCRSTIAFATGAKELLAWRSHLRSALDVDLEIMDHEVSWSLYFADPDGNPYEVTSYEYNELAPALRKAGA